MHRLCLLSLEMDSHPMEDTQIKRGQLLSGNGWKVALCKGIKDLLSGRQCSRVLSTFNNIFHCGDEHMKICPFADTLK